MKLYSWNVNGLRAVRKKGFDAYLAQSGADVFCIQETKLQVDQLDMLDASYHPYFHDAEKKGYSGTAILSRSVPLSVSYGIGHPLDNEGRTVTCEYPDFYVVCCYTPNSQRELTRLSLRMEWDAAFRGYVSQLDQQKPVLICGDLNVAHQPIDIRNPKSNEGNAGYTNEERESFSRLLDAGFVDSFRYLHPDAVDQYSWWSFRPGVRQHNIGWRIDYWLVSDRYKEHIKESSIAMDVMGSDHAPVILVLD
ncbi:MAG: exodeoxyribonuclease III [Sphaerochaeta sp.]|jgi:exodeoxyribonuclease-3|nr:exodeoxyribonuclease III [Sphaerochaeta sp.]MCH3920464.1 exodeoxyribonuclease III [Sphaerochaeta sp.]